MQHQQSSSWHHHPNHHDTLLFVTYPRIYTGVSTRGRRWKYLYQEHTKQQSIYRVGMHTHCLMKRTAFSDMVDRDVSTTVTVSKSTSHHQPQAHYTFYQTARLNQYVHPSLMLHAMMVVVVDLSTALALVIWHMQRQLKSHLKKIDLVTFLFIWRTKIWWRKQQGVLPKKSSVVCDLWANMAISHFPITLINKSHHRHHLIWHFNNSIDVQQQLEA